jgi:hypothetical protein
MTAVKIETTAPVLGTLDVVPIDYVGESLTTIWDMSKNNRLDCTIELTGAYHGNYFTANPPDKFTLVAYFQPQSGGNVIQVPAPAMPFLGSSGDNDATRLRFTPSIPGCSLKVPANLPEGAYRVVVVLSHIPGSTGGAGNPRIAGFYDFGIITLYTTP